MKLKKYYFLICTILSFFINMDQVSAQVKVTDTVYYNKYWEMCEKPIAAYYREGVLAAMGKVWYFIGEVKDYAVDYNQLLMSGIYSTAGTRQGIFRFYYPGGSPKAWGEYKNGRMYGNWFWYYPDGKVNAIIYFPADEQRFQFIKFIDEQGKITLENGTGNFTWYTNPLDTARSMYVFTGEYKAGNRSGDWHFNFTSSNEKPAKGFTEKYDHDGRFLGILYENDKFSKFNFPNTLDFTPIELIKPEKMYFDDLFRINGDSLALHNLAAYLVEHQPTEVNLQGKIFDTAFDKILKAFDRSKYKLHFNQQRNIDAKIAFMIGTKAGLENISFSGDGLDITEMNFFTFLLGKFKNVEMPGDGNVVMETNYTIYCYTIDFREMMPENIDVSSTKELVFSFKTKEKMEKYLHDNKDELQKMIKRKIIYADHKGN